MGYREGAGASLPILRAIQEPLPFRTGIQFGTPHRSSSAAMSKQMRSLRDLPLRTGRLASRTIVAASCHLYFVPERHIPASEANSWSLRKTQFLATPAP